MEDSGCHTERYTIVIPAILTMLVVLAIVIGVALVAAVGIGGRGGSYASPTVARALQRTAAHMNGDATAPKALGDLLR